MPASPPGRPGIVLAIWDIGVKSAAGAPVHNDFRGVLSDGTPKVASSTTSIACAPTTTFRWLATTTAAVSRASPRHWRATAERRRKRLRLCRRGAERGSDDDPCGSHERTPSEISSSGCRLPSWAPFRPGGSGLSPTTRETGRHHQLQRRNRGEDDTLSAAAQAALDWVTTFGRAGKGTLASSLQATCTGHGNRIRPGPHTKRALASRHRHGTAALRGTRLLRLRAPRAVCTDGRRLADSRSSGPVDGLGCLPGRPGRLGRACPRRPPRCPIRPTRSDEDQGRFDRRPVGGRVIHIGPIGAHGSEPARIKDLPTILNWWRTTVSGFGNSAFDAPCGMPRRRRPW